jgi:hypothetical protein
MSKRLGLVLMLVALCLGSAAPAYAWYGYRGYGYRGYRRPSVVIVPRIVVPFGPYWAPYAYPPVVVAPAPPVAAQTPAPHDWYYCDSAQVYYPYVQQCPGGWRAVVPTSP